MVTLDINVIIVLIKIYAKHERNVLEMNNRKLSLVTDFYELTMSNGYFENNMQDTIAYFDVFF